MSLDPNDPIAQQRRARLAAERQLARKSATAKTDHARMERHARTLTDTIMAKRAELVSLQQEAEALRAAHREAQTSLDRAKHQIQTTETRLWQALQTVRDGFALFDSDHRLVLANRAFLSIFDDMDCVAPGITHRELCDLMIEEGIVDPQGPADGWAERMAARWENDVIEPATITLWNGQIVKLIDRPTPDGGMVTLGVNQTDAFRIRAATETLPDAFCLFDRDERLVMCNQNYREFLGIDLEATRPGTEFADILRECLSKRAFPEASGREDEWLEERLTTFRDADGTPHDIEIGGGRWMRVIESPTPDGGRVGLRIDVTSLKAQQRALEVARDEAQAASRAKSSFLANMSHEFRTPMNGIVGMADLLLGADLDEERTGFVATIRSSAEALCSVLDDVLDFSSLEGESLRLHEAPCDLSEVIGGVLAMQGSRAAEAKTALALDYPAEVPRHVIADALRLRQVMANLVGNAVKFTQAGRVDVSVRGAIENGRAELQILVEDTGIGIAPDRVETIFDGFRQAEEGRQRNHDGAGLGLSICRKVLALMGGRIWVDADRETGALFGVAVSLRPAEADKTAAPNVPQSSPAGRAAIRILAAEDNKTNQLVLRKTLASEDVELVIAGDGAEAVAIYAQERPDLVFMDISMPRMDGKTATQELRRLESENGWPRVRVVALTAHALGGDSEDILAAGLDAVLTKPLKKGALIAEIDRVRASLV